MCPLCHSERVTLLPLAADRRPYYRCGRCDLRFLDPALRIEAGEEQRRYLHHRTHMADEGYRRFVDPLLEKVAELVPAGGRILDFGAGHQPVLAEWLRERHYEVEVFDPFFWPQTPVGLFDGVVACEVIEHLFSPYREFQRVREWLKPGGIFVCMTDIYRESMDFGNWYYRRDPTHVVFYSEPTLRWIANHWFGSRVQISGRLACFLV